VLYLGASAAPEHVRQDHRCCHEVLCRRELRWGCRDSSPSAPRSIVLELRLDSGFAADAFHPCRRLLSSDGTAAATGIGPAHLRATTVCFPRCRYFQWILFSTNARNCCVFLLYYILNVQGDCCFFPTARPRQPETTTPRASIFPLGGFRSPVFQFAVVDSPSSSTPLCSSLVSTRPQRTSWVGMSLGTATFSRPWMPATGR
jgi:hypothetical protein